MSVRSTRGVFPGLFLSICACLSTSAHEFGTVGASGEFEDYQTIGLHSGVVYPRGGLGANYGPLIGVHALYHFSQRWGLGIELDHMAFNKNVSESLAPYPSFMERKEFSMVVSGRFSPFYRKLASPLLTAGVGAHHWTAAHVHLTKDANGLLAPSEPHKGQGFMPTFLLGGGLTGRVVDYFVWDIVARWHFLPEPQEFRKQLTTNPGQAFSLSILASMEL